MDGFVPEGPGGTDRSQRPGRPRGDGNEHRQPRPSLTAVSLIEPFAQARQTALQVAVDRPDRSAGPSRDLARRQAVEEARQNRRPIRFVQPEHRLGQLAMRRRALDDRGGRFELLASRDVRLAPEAPPVSAHDLTHAIEQHGSQPTAQLAGIAWTSLERGQARLLREIIGQVDVRHELAREPANPSDLRDESFGCERVRSHGAAAGTPPAWLLPWMPAGALSGRRQRHSPQNQTGRHA